MPPSIASELNSTSRCISVVMHDVVLFIFFLILFYLIFEISVSHLVVLYEVLMFVSITTHNLKANKATMKGGDTRQM